jgi:hypothetical protein
MAGGERALLAAWLCVAALGAPAVRAESGAPEPRARAGWLAELDRGLGDALAPGELARVHAESSGVARCSDCHAGLDATPDAKCLACHEDVGARIDAGAGWHGTFRAACSSCHGEHRGAGADLLGLDRKAFNHDLALFPLRGAHGGVECAKCHAREGRDGSAGFHPIGIEHGTCAACHDDVHGADFTRGRDCGTCHTERGFGATALARKKGAAFDHASDAGFVLAGRHAAVPCSACHTRETRARELADGLAPGRGAPRECASCHEDPHRGTLGAACATCHVPDGWSGEALRFDHARDTSFPLDATHAALDCASCHADRRFAAKAEDCAGCHPDAAALLAGRFRAHPEGAPDPHQGTVPCAGCHGDLRAGARLIDYERACASCHPAEYGALLLSRKRILDGLVVGAETALRTRDLALARGDAADPPRDSAGLAGELDLLARSGAHNPALAEAILRRLGESLRPAEAAAGAP